jgi:hypothetical protein
MTADDSLECAICGERIAKADAIRAGWKAYGPLEEGEDPFNRSSDTPLSIRCSLCALGSVLVATQTDVAGEPAFEDALEHYRAALKRKEWDN